MKKIKYNINRNDETSHPSCCLPAMPSSSSWRILLQCDEAPSHSYEASVLPDGLLCDPPCSTAAGWLVSAGGGCTSALVWGAGAWGGSTTPSLPLSSAISWRHWIPGNLESSSMSPTYCTTSSTSASSTSHLSIIVLLRSLACLTERGQSGSPVEFVFL